MPRSTLSTGKSFVVHPESHAALHACLSQQQQVANPSPFLDAQCTTLHTPPDWRLGETVHHLYKYISQLKCGLQLPVTLHLCSGPVIIANFWPLAWAMYHWAGPLMTGPTNRLARPVILDRTIHWLKMTNLVIGFQWTGLSEWTRPYKWTLTYEWLYKYRGL